MSLPPVGTERRNKAAAAPTASTGPARERRSRGCSRIWRMTMSTRMALITYMVMVFMPLACAAVPPPGVGPRVGAWVDNQVNPRVDPSASAARSVAGQSHGRRRAGSRPVNRGSGWTGLVYPGAADPSPGVLPCPDRLAAAAALVPGSIRQGAVQGGRRRCLLQVEPDRARCRHRETGPTGAEMAEVRLTHSFVDLHGHPRSSLPSNGGPQPGTGSG